MHPDPGQDRPTRSRLARTGWSALGLACVGLGALGVVLPGLPTTPFLVLAAACFAKSSERLYAWLLGHRVFGRLIRDYREGRGVSPQVKLIAIGTMWVFVLFALGPGLPAGSRLPRIVVGAAATAGTLFLLRLPTRRDEGTPRD